MSRCPHLFRMAKYCPPLRLNRLGLFLLDFLRRHSVRGYRLIWGALWRLWKKIFTVYPPRLPYNLAFLSSILYWKETGCNRPGLSNSNAYAPCYGLIDPNRGVPVLGAGAVAGAAMPYMLSEDGPPAYLSPAHTHPQILSTASTQVDDPVTFEPMVIPPANTPPLSDTSSPSYDSEKQNFSVHSSARSSGASTSSETLNSIPLQILTVEALSGSGSLHSVRPALPANPVHRMGSVGSSASLWEISEYVWPMIPTQVPRYKNNRIIEPVESEFTIRPAQKHFERDNIPPGWCELTHPEGQPYFYHTRPDMTIITETWIGDSELFKPLDEFIDNIIDFIRSKNLTFHDTDLVVYCSLDDQMKAWCGYYFVCHTTRSLFWLENFQIDAHLEELRGELHPTHIKLFLESQYWYNWGLYPDVNKATVEILDMLTNTILDAQTDILTGNESTVNYTESSLSAMANVVETARKHVAPGHQVTTWYIGRFMAAIWRDRFLNFHGQYGARLSRKQSVHVRDQKVPRSYLFKILSPMLFSAPNVHLKTMTGIWVDKLTLKAPWGEFFTRLSDEWQGHTVYASILLTANVAFLAIPSNDNAGPYTRSATQIASYVSVVTSFSSMMLALMLRRQHRTRERGTAREVAEFLGKKHHSSHGLEILAIVYSLPYAILMWGMVTFILAFFIMCFAKSTMATRFCVGLVSLFCAALVAWCIWVSWEPSESLEWWKAQLRWQTSEVNEETTRFWQRLCSWRQKKPLHSDA